MGKVSKWHKIPTSEGTVLSFLFDILVAQTGFYPWDAGRQICLKINVLYIFSCLYRLCHFGLSQTALFWGLVRTRIVYSRTNAGVYGNWKINNASLVILDPAYNLVPYFKTINSLIDSIFPLLLLVIWRNDEAISAMNAWY